MYIVSYKDMSAEWWDVMLLIFDLMGIMINQSRDQQSKRAALSNQHYTVNASLKLLNAICDLPQGSIPNS